MTFCGYHPAMSSGLLTFGEGVALSTLLKARAARRGVAEHTQVELEQLAALREELARAERQAPSLEARRRARVLANLAALCEECFLTAQGISTEDAFQEHFSQQFVEFGELIRRLEDAYEGCVPGTSITDRTRVGVEAAVSDSEDATLTG
jgi:hypothetical protein